MFVAGTASPGHRAKARCMLGPPIIRPFGVFGTPKLPRTLRVGPKSRSVNLLPKPKAGLCIQASA